MAKDGVGVGYSPKGVELDLIGATKTRNDHLIKPYLLEVT